MVHLRTLGSIELRSAEGSLLPARPRVLLLLAWLLRRPGARARRDEAASLLWERGDSTRARHSLRQAIAELRSVLPVGTLEADAEELLVRPESVTVDRSEFEALAAGGQLAEALALVMGEFLPGHEDAGGEAWRQWLDAERARLGAGIGACCHQLVGNAMAAGEWRAATAHAERWRALRPADERAVVALIRAQLAAGEVIAATSVHDAWKQQAEEEGAEPGREFLRLQDQLRAMPAVGGARRGLLSPDLCGRQREFELLSAHWRAVEAGQAAMVAIEGEDGAGRSRLVAEFVRQLRQPPDRAVVVEWAPGLAEQEPSHAVAAALADRLAEAPGILAADRRDLESVARISPRLAQRFPTETLTSLPALAEALSRVLAEVGAERPVLLVVDDASLADQESQSLLGALSRRLPPRVMIVVSARASAWAGSRLHEALRGAGDRVSWLRLAPLSAQATTELIRSMAPMAPEAAEQIARAALDDLGGLPGPTRALVEALAESGRLKPGSDGTWDLVGALERPVVLPDAVRDATREMLRALAAPARAILEAASLQPRGLPTADLERASGLEPAPFGEALGELLAARRLRLDGAEGQVVAFPSEAARRAVAELVSPAWRATVERRLSCDPGATRRRRHWWLAAAALLLGIAGSLAFLWTSPAAEPGATIIVADVRNETGDPRLDEVLTLAAMLDLVESERFRVFSRSRIRETLARMGQAGADSLFDETLAREVAERAGVPLVLAIAARSADQGYSLVARLVHPETGDPIRTLVEPVRGDADLLRGLQRLTRRVRRTLGESRSAVAASDAHLEVTTNSLEALREFTRGQAAWSRRDYGAAGLAWQRAVALDSNFAMAHVALADLHFFANRYPQGNAALQRAAELEDHLTPRERLLVRARVADRFGPAETGIQHRRELAERYPDRDTWYNYGSALMRARRCEEGLPALRRALDFDPQFTNGHINVATCFLQLSERDSALVAYHRAEATDSSVLRVGNIGEEYGRTLALRGDRAAAERHFRRMTSWGDPGNQARGYRHLAWLALAAGEARSAEALAAQAVGRYTDAPVYALSRFRDRLLHATTLVEAGRLTDARRLVEVTWRGRPDSMVSPPFVRDVAVLAWRTGAGGLLPELRAALEVPWRVPQLGADGTIPATVDGALELVFRQRPDSALATTARAMAGLDPDRWHVFLAIRAEALERLGREEEALALWQRLAARPTLNQEGQLVWQTADLHAARLAARLGRTAEAWESLNRLLERWAGADPDLPALRGALALREQLERGG